MSDEYAQMKYILLAKRSKIPIEKDWHNTANYNINDPKIKKHLDHEGNLGILLGTNDLRCIDIDNPEKIAELRDKLKTREHQTGSGKAHFLFRTTYNKNHVLKKESGKIGELRSFNQCIVAPGSIHPDTGKRYEIINPPLPIREIDEEELLSILNPYLQTNIPAHSKERSSTDQTRSGREWGEVCNLIKECYSKEEIFKKMMASSKWKDGTPQYRELTYKKAQERIQFQNDIKDLFTNKLEFASKFVSMHPLFFDNAKIWWKWDEIDHRWVRVDETDIMNLIDEALHDPKTVQSQTKNEILESLRREARRKSPHPIKPTWIQFKNMIYDIENDEKIKVTPEYFATNPIPWEVGESEETPVIDKIFSEWVGEKYKQILYEIIAFCLLPSYPLHRIFCFVGSGSNGKTKYLEIISIFIGKDNQTATELDDLINSRFESASLYKKLVCFIGETNFGTLRRTSILKRLCGGDPIKFEFKGKDTFNDLNYAKILISTNTLPTTTDKTKGFYRRWIIIEFPHEFSEKIDIIKTIPIEEFPNLAKKSIRILTGLLNKREFTNEGTIEEREQRYEERSDPFTKFIEEKCLVDANDSVEFFRFFDMYLNFVNERGFRKPSKLEVGARLKAEGYSHKNKKYKKDDGNESSCNWIEGLSLRPDSKKPGTDQKDVSPFDAYQQNIGDKNEI